VCADALEASYPLADRKLHKLIRQVRAGGAPTVDGGFTVR